MKEARSDSHAQEKSRKELRDQVCTLELTLNSCANLPSVGQTQESVDLQKEVFDILLGMVNTKHGAATYHSPEQALSFQKHVQFGDRSSVPGLKLDSSESGESEVSTTPIIKPASVPSASTPYPRKVRSAMPLDQMFDVSGIPQFHTMHQDAATIATEVSAAAAAQASKEFQHMQEPKIMKFKGGYSADAELVFRSWYSDILSHIQDRELDNKSAIQLIKDHMLDNACREVEFQLDLCSSVIKYQDLLHYLSVAFQGGDDEAQILAEFYSCSQKPKESEEVFADELQVLAQKVLSKKPTFGENLNSTLKQHYTSQLYDNNSASIAKTLLKQMPKASFMEFHNELA